MIKVGDDFVEQPAFGFSQTLPHMHLVFETCSVSICNQTRWIFLNQGRKKDDEETYRYRQIPNTSKTGMSVNDLI